MTKKILVTLLGAYGSLNGIAPEPTKPVNHPVSTAMYNTIIGHERNKALNPDQQANLKLLLNTGSCKSPVKKPRDLGGVDLTGLKLADGADFTGTDMHGVLLRGVKMHKANFTNTILNAADSNANPGANEKYEKADFSGSIFKNTQMNSAVMPETIFDGSTFAKTSAKNQIPGKAKGSQSHETNFTKSSFKKCIFNNANLYYARMDKADLSDSIFKDCQFDFAVLNGVTFKGSSGINFTQMVPKNISLPEWPKYNGNQFGANTVICGTVAPDGVVWFIPSQRGQCTTNAEARTAIIPGLPNNTPVAFLIPGTAPNTIKTIGEMRSLLSD